MNALLRQLDARPDTKWSVLVVGTEKVAAEQNSPAYTRYRLLITDGTQSWRISKRYSQLLELHNHVRVLCVCVCVLFFVVVFVWWRAIYCCPNREERERE